MKESIVSQIPKNLEAVLPASEEVVVFPDRTIIVIGTDHGSITFPGKKQTEQEIQNFEARYGKINALTIDSQLDWEKDPYLLKLSIDPQTGAQNSDIPAFQNWGLVAAMHNSIPLIGADPMVTVPYLIPIVSKEEFRGSLTDIVTPRYRRLLEKHPSEDYLAAKRENVKKQEIYFQRTQELEANLNRRRQLEVAKGVVDAVLIGSILYLGVKLTRPYSRRNFLKLAGAIGVSAAAEGSMRTFQNSFTAQITQLTKLRENITKELVAFEYYPFKKARDDHAEIADVFVSPHQLTQEYYQLSAFQRLAEFNSTIYTYTDILRNALIAEALNAPLQNIFGENINPPVKIPIVMGNGHLILPKEYQISTLLKDQQARRKLLNELLNSLFTGLNNLTIETASVDKYSFIEGFKHFAKTYWIDKSGKVKAKSIQVQAIDDIVDKIVQASKSRSNFGKGGGGAISGNSGK